MSVAGIEVPGCESQDRHGQCNVFRGANSLKT